MHRTLKKILRPIWRILRPVREALSGVLASVVAHAVRGVVARQRPRSWLNKFYQKLGSKGQQKFYEATGGCFREGNHTIADGDWSMHFGGRQFSLPLTSNRIWLDWESALAALGHETFLKEFYRALLTGPHPPEIFVDIGANYGNHSLLFLIHGVDVLTFEPNSSCHAYFQEACSLNGVRPRLNGVALGESRAEFEMFYPPRATWLGSIEPSTIERLRTQTALVTQRVEVHRLDEYFEELKGRRVLIKIDAEGHEVSVLKGANETLSRLRPPVLFESWNGNDKQRTALLSIFRDVNYLVADVPLLGGKSSLILDDAAFMASHASDFIAFASERATDSSYMRADSLYNAQEEQHEGLPFPSP